jgi:hypothetical protein
MQCVPSLCVLLVLLLVSLSTRVQADTVYLKGGGRIDGKIVKQDETWVHVETRKFGVQKIRRQNILRVLTAEDEYEERKKACGAEDAKARYELGLWCKENTLFKQAYQEFRAALKADPDHELARQELGYVRRGDRWVPKDDPIARRYPYAQATIYNLARLTEGEKAWVEPGDPWNDQGLLEREHEPTGLRFVLIPGGVFRMGSDVASEEQPVHEVRLKPFLLCRTECTERAWIRLGGSRIKRKRGANHPVCGRSFHDLICWFQKADLRLPSEAEWEYACRAGGKGPLEPWQRRLCPEGLCVVPGQRSWGWTVQDGPASAEPVGPVRPAREREGSLCRRLEQELPGSPNRRRSAGEQEHGIWQRRWCS